ncbi:VOC family protein [Acuticoccus yangtzensis]|uniref:VOC family protein n=1 Tax=Acuticoccus yangtzensis TaxID=1443441 RepID=UPI0009498D40|nr:VOC family protein [Acuticoccus yangtzensis]
MQQQISVITLGVADLARSARFYQDGFGWAPVFQNEEIVFYQMNGVILGTFLKDSLAADMNRPGFSGPAAFALAHNVATAEPVAPVIDALIAAGGRLLQPASAPPHGGLRGYVADPDDHAWEIAFMPGITIAEDGRVSFDL